MQVEAFSDLSLVDVDYKMPIDDLIVLMRGSFTEFLGYPPEIIVDGDINEKRFPAIRSERGIRNRVAFSLLSLHPHEEEGRKRPASLRAIEEMNRQGYDPATIREFFFFATQHPEIAVKNTIVVLGSVLIAEVPDSERREREGFKSVPLFVRRGKRFCLELLWFRIEWPGGCNFLAKTGERSAEFLCFSF